MAIEACYFAGNYGRRHTYIVTMPPAFHHRPRTRLVHAGTMRSPFGEASEALFITQGYVYPNAEAAERLFDSEIDEDGYTYSRYSNPTVDMFINRLAAYEEAEAGRGFASGMAAVTAALLCQLETGDHVVAGRSLFGSCRYVLETLLPKYGIQTTLVDGTDIAAWQAAIQPQTKVFFAETPANPTLEIIDLAAVAALAHANGAFFVVDNALASPVIQKPLALGADAVVYSTTKHIDGHGRCLGGAFLGGHAFVHDILTPFFCHTGSSMSPFNAWNFLKSLETLELRCLAQASTAARIAEELTGQAGLLRLLYPGLPGHPGHEIAARQMKNGGTVLSLDFRGEKKAAFAFLNALKIILISNNLGDSRSLATHPATTTHVRLPAELRAELGITEGLVRISCGLEDPEDILGDILQACEKAGG